jgi:predicted alpha/beta-hydrolase family hydrolase
MILTDSAQAPIAHLVLAHGAGAGMRSEFMAKVAELFSQRSITVTRFDFEYMQRAGELNRRQPPDRMPKLQAYFTHILANLDAGLPLFIGGKSMGGRVASMLLDKSYAKGGICFGYPFHPPGKLDKLRTEHLEVLSKPLLVLQGSRDTFGTKEEVSNYALADSVQTIFLPDGDHSLKPRKRSGFTEEAHIIAAVDAGVAFIKRHVK